MSRALTTEKLYKLETVVKPILEEQPITRSDDYVLFAEVCKSLKPELLDFSLCSILYQHTELGLPNFESVGRCRRRIQEKCPELAIPKTVKNRQKQEAVYKEYATG